MYYSWTIANEEDDPTDVPKKDGVDIVWDHGNKDASIKAAREMAGLFHLAHKPSLKSNHIRGLAVDMDISWKGDLFLGPLPNGKFEGILEGPRNGADNRQLHDMGELFGVIKLISDAPHWSYNGR